MVSRKYNVRARDVQVSVLVVADDAVVEHERALVGAWMRKSASRVDDLQGKDVHIC